MANGIRNFRDLDAWKSGMDLVLLTYDLSEHLPDRERFGLCSQMRRAAVSIPSNVAEGHAFRTNPKGYSRYVRIALGSLAELETHVEVALRLEFVKPGALKTFHGAATRTGQLLHGLLRALKLRIRQPRGSECRVRTTLRSSRPVAVHRSRRRRTPTTSIGKAAQRR